MNMSPSQIEYIRHIRDEINYLIKSSRDTTIEKFLIDETAQRAFVRSLEVIGEATKKLSSEFKSKYPEIEWRVIAGTRDKLIHDYFGVDLELVWDIVATKIPQLKDQVERIIQIE